MILQFINLRNDHFSSDVISVVPRKTGKKHSRILMFAAIMHHNHEAMVNYIPIQEYHNSANGHDKILQTPGY